MIVGRGINLMSMKNYINYNNLKKIVKIINFTKIHFLSLKNQICLSSRLLMKDYQMYYLKLWF